MASLDRLFGSSVRLVLLGSLYSLSSSLITALIQLVTLGLGAYFILTGSFTTGSLFAFLGLLGSVTSPVESFTQLLQQLQQATGSMQRVTQIIDEPVEVKDAPDAVPLPASVNLREVLGAEVVLHLASPAGELTVRTDAHAPARAGDDLTVWLDPGAVHLFDARSELRL